LSVQPDAPCDVPWLRLAYPDAEPWQLDELSKCRRFDTPVSPLEAMPPADDAAAV
jgi:hypothetical protein